MKCLRSLNYQCDVEDVEEVEDVEVCQTDFREEAPHSSLHPATEASFTITRSWHTLTHDDFILVYRQYLCPLISPFPN